MKSKYKSKGFIVTNIESNKIIKSLWLGNRLSNMERLTIKSFLDCGHVFHLYCYDEIKNLPSGTVLMDANKIISKEQIFLDSAGGYASFSDLFRYKLLFDLGGWWVDMDVACLKFLDFEDDYCFSSELFDNGNQSMISNFIIKAPKGADFLLEILNYILPILESSDHIAWGEFGPKLLSHALKTYDCKSYIRPTEVFCPINWSEISKFISFSNIQISESCYCVHFWNEIWRRGNLDKDSIYHADSLYEQLKRKFKVYE